MPLNHENPSPFKQGARSPLRNIPGGNSPDFIKIDPAHTYAIDGIGKSFLGSTIIMLIRMGHFGNNAIDKCFDVAYKSFVQYLTATGKSTSITSFDYGTFKLKRGPFLILYMSIFFVCGREAINILSIGTPTNIQQLSGFYLRLCSFPAGLGKGHDAAVLGSWLASEVLRVDDSSIEPGSLPIPMVFVKSVEWGFYRNHGAPFVSSHLLCTQENQFKDILEVIQYTCTACDRFWRTTYQQGIFIPRDVGVQLVADGFAFTVTGFISGCLFSTFNK